MTIIRNGYDQAKPIETYYTVKEVAYMIGTSKTKVRMDVMRGKIPFVLTGKTVGIPKEAVADYIAANGKD